MNRRGFLKLLGIGAATAAVDPQSHINAIQPRPRPSAHDWSSFMTYGTTATFGSYVGSFDVHPIHLEPDLDSLRWVWGEVAS